MLKKILFCILFNICVLQAYILQFKRLNNNEIENYDVGAKANISGKEIRELLKRELKISYDKLVIFKPTDLKSEEKKRILEDTDFVDVIGQTNKGPIIYQIKP